MEDIIELKGKKDGPISTILVGVHGNEHCGIDAIKKILPTLQIERGVLYIGYGNPHAIEKNVRFTEANLNRMFKPDTTLTQFEIDSYEYQRAQYLKKYLDLSEVLLDIHASSNPQSKVFAICEKNAHNIVSYFPVPIIVSGFDTVEPGGTDYYMNKQGKIGICIECGYLADQKSTQVALDVIESFLNVRGHKEKKLNTIKQTYIHVYKLYLTKTDRFSLRKKFSDFEAIEAGEIIGFDGGEKIIAEKDSLILFAKERSKKQEEAFLLAEYK